MASLAEASLADIRISRSPAESAEASDCDLSNLPETPDLGNPAAMLGDERRLQVRAYRLWQELDLGDEVPAVEDLRPAERGDIGSHGILIDLTMGIAEPTIAYLGAVLAEICDRADYFALREIPERSLLGRLTEHCLDVVANRVPVGFEAEFIDGQERLLLYRSLLMPFSSDGQAIDFVFGVISWKEDSGDRKVSAPPAIAQPAPAVPPAALEAPPAKSFAQALADARHSAALARANKLQTDQGRPSSALDSA